MKAIARLKGVDEWPTEVRAVEHPSQVFLEDGQVYEVHAVAVVDGMVLLQVIVADVFDKWYSSWFFETVDTTLPSDWICSVFPTAPQVLLGPAYVARDQEAFTRMVDKELTEEDLFWERVQRLEAEHRGAAETAEHLRWAERVDLPDGRPRQGTPPEQPDEA